MGTLLSDLGPIKIGFDFLLDILAKMPKFYKMPKCLHFGSVSYIRIFILTLITLEPEKRTYIGETHLKMTTRARAFFLLKNRRNDLKRLGHPTFIRLSKIRFHNPSFDTVV